MLHYMSVTYGLKAILRNTIEWIDAIAAEQDAETAFESLWDIAQPVPNTDGRHVGGITVTRMRDPGHALKDWRRRAVIRARECSAEIERSRHAQSVGAVQRALANTAAMDDAELALALKIYVGNGGYWIEPPNGDTTASLFQVVYLGIEGLGLTKTEAARQWRRGAQSFVEHAARAAAA